MRKKRLGQALIERKRISNETLEKIIHEQGSSTTPLGFLGELLLERGLVSRDDLVAALEEVTLFRFVDPRFATVEKAVLERVPREAVERAGRREGFGVRRCERCRPCRRPSRRS